MASISNPDLQINLIAWNQLDFLVAHDSSNDTFTRTELEYSERVTGYFPSVGVMQVTVNYNKEGDITSLKGLSDTFKRKISERYTALLKRRSAIKNAEYLGRRFAMAELGHTFKGEIKAEGYDLQSYRHNLHNQERQKRTLSRAGEMDSKLYKHYQTSVDYHRNNINSKWTGTPPNQTLANNLFQSRIDAV